MPPFITKRHRNPAHTLNSPGFAAAGLTEAQAAALRRDRRVASVTPAGIVSTQTYTTQDYLGLSGAGGLWQAEWGSNTEDVANNVLIGVVDSGEQRSSCTASLGVCTAALHVLQHPHKQHVCQLMRVGLLKCAPGIATLPRLTTPGGLAVVCRRKPRHQPVARPRARWYQRCCGLPGARNLLSRQGARVQVSSHVRVQPWL